MLHVTARGIPERSECIKLLATQALHKNPLHELAVLTQTP
jgi:hypothetical protein